MWQWLPACVGVYRITTQVIASKRWLSSLKIVNSQRQKKTCWARIRESAKERAAAAVPNTAVRELTCARERKVNWERAHMQREREREREQGAVAKRFRTLSLMIANVVVVAAALLLLRKFADISSSSSSSRQRQRAAGRAGCAAWLMKIIVTRQIFKCVVGFAFALLLFFACA